MGIRKIQKYLFGRYSMGRHRPVMGTPRPTATSREESTDCTGTKISDFARPPPRAAAPSVTSQRLSGSNGGGVPSTARPEAAHAGRYHHPGS